MLGPVRADVRCMSDLSVNAASSVQQAMTRDAVGVAVARKTLDAVRQEGDAAVELIESAARIGQEQARAPRAEPGRVDLYA